MKQTFFCRKCKKDVELELLAGGMANLTVGGKGCCKPCNREYMAKRLARKRSGE